MPRVSAAEKGRKNKIRQQAQNMEHYLNECEEILSAYSLADQKEEQLARLGVLIGKSMITFCELAEYGKFYEE